MTRSRIALFAAALACATAACSDPGATQLPPVQELTPPPPPPSPVHADTAADTTSNRGR